MYPVLARARRGPRPSEASKLEAFTRAWRPCGPNDGSKRDRNEVDDPVSRRAAFLASIALLVFSALTGFALIGWFYRAEALWSWKSVLAAGCTALAVTTSALLWRTPTRMHAIMG